MYGILAVLFQSTPPVKAATLSVATSYVMYGFQSTPPVKAATQEAVVDAGLYEISIHAAREGGDAMFTLSVAAGFLFQSTPPVKAATLLS